MDKYLGMSARMFFRAFTIAMLILIMDKSAIWGVPLGLIIGICSEAENITKK